MRIPNKFVIYMCEQENHRDASAWWRVTEQGAYQADLVIASGFRPWHTWPTGRVAWSRSTIKYIAVPPWGPYSWPDAPREIEDQMWSEGRCPSGSIERIDPGRYIMFYGLLFDSKQRLEKWVNDMMGGRIW